MRDLSSVLRPPPSAPAADELQHDFSPVRPSAVLGDVDALPRAKRKGTGTDRHLERNTCEHRLHMRGHVVRPFDIVHPAGIVGRNASKRGRKVGTHIGIGIFLDDERGRCVPYEIRRLPSFAFA